MATTTLDVSPVNREPEFMHPKVAIVPIPGKGKGMIALEDFEIGELVLAEYPIVASEDADPSFIVDKLLDHKEASTQLWCPPKFKLVESAFNEVSDEDYSRALAQVQCNAFYHKGKFILNYRCSFINHSCWPNACLLCSDDWQFKVHLIQPVRKGEEICFCYKTQLLYLPTSMRREKLKAIYGFDCVCARCLPSMTPPNPHDGLITKIHNLPDNCTQAQKAMNFMETFYEKLDSKSLQRDSSLWQLPAVRCRKLEEFIRAPFGLEFPSTRLDSSHWRMNLMRMELISLYLEREKYFEASELIVQQMKSDMLILPQFHNAKLAAYVAHKEVLSKLTADEQHKVKESAKEIDINSLEKILSIFGIH
jgi:hypothetical protein